MICAYHDRNRPCAPRAARFGLAGLMLALAGCAVGSGKHTANAPSAQARVVSSTSPASDLESSAANIAPDLKGAQRALPQPSLNSPVAGSAQAPLATNDRQAPAVSATPRVNNGPTIKPPRPARNAPRAIAQASDPGALAASDNSRPAPAAQRARRVQGAPLIIESPGKVSLRRDTKIRQVGGLEESTPLTSDPDASSAEGSGSPPPVPVSSQKGASQKDETAVDDLPPSTQVHIPLEEDSQDELIELTPMGDRITLVVRDAPLSSVLNLLAKQRGLNVIVGDDTDSRISVTLSDVDFSEAWSAIVDIAGCTWTQSNNIIMVSSVSNSSKASPLLQDRQLRVFPLNFVAADDVSLVVKGILSPAGKVFTMQTVPKERRSTQETVVVEDIPPYLKRVAEYIAAVDVPPRQVMIEVHILQITLEDNCTHGVNLQYLFGAGGNNIVMSTVGFANPAATTAALFTVSGAHFNSVVQALESTTDSKTLASPKVIVANGQQARIQIGQRFGYFVTTTTQTSTLQNVNFLNTGVVLSVTPQISADNQVLMSVTPEVSTGQITNGLPQTETTTTDTTVLLPDGCGMVIGGLIKEQDIETQDKVPILGDLRVVGRLFQKRVVNRQRVEIIIALLPRIAPYPPGYEVQHQIELEQAFTPLMQGPLNRAPRPFESKLPDAYANPRNLRLNRLPDAVRNLDDPYPLPLGYFFPTAEEENPPVVPPPPLPLPSLALPPLPGPAQLPPVDIIVPDGAEAANQNSANAAALHRAPAKSANGNSLKVGPVKSKPTPIRQLPAKPASSQTGNGQGANGQSATGQSGPGRRMTRRSAADAPAVTVDKS